MHLSKAHAALRSARLRRFSEVRMRRMFLGLLISVALPMPACTTTYVASRYSVSADNVRTLRTFKGQFVKVGPFSAANPGQTEIMCRGAGGIRTPDGETYEDWVRQAFLDELTIAELYSADAPITLTGTLDAIDFSSMAGVIKRAKLLSC
jgi:hypothetical protein